jgi:hypothetical protein
MLFSPLKVCTSVCQLLRLPSKPGGPSDQEQSCHNDDRPDGSRDALACRCEAFGADGRRHDNHRAKIHDSHDQEDRDETDTALGALKAETQAVSPSCAYVSPHRSVAPG